MKRTVTTILSLALAMILVSSLGNGVSYADGKKDRERKVVIVECIKTASGLFIQVDVFDKSSSVDIMLPAEDTTPDFSCAENVAFLLKNKFRMEDVSSVPDGFFRGTTRYTFVKK